MSNLALSNDITNALQTSAFMSGNLDDYILSLSPLAYYKLDELLYTDPLVDSAGGWGDGTYQGTSSFGNPPLTQAGGASVYFNASGRRGDLPAGEMSVNGQPFSFSVFVKAISMSSTRPIMTWRMNIGGTPIQYWLDMESSGRLTIRPNPNNDKFKTNEAAIAGTTTVHHIVGVHDTVDWKMYVDGVPMTKISTFVFSNSNTANVVGSAAAGGAFSYPGYIDRLAFWNNKELSADEAAAIAGYRL